MASNDAMHIEQDSSEKSSKSNDEKDGKENNANFECNICLDIAKDAVISMCGHLFCWQCLHQWLETKRAHQTCPVCKAAISKDKVIPLYGRGSVDQKDPRDKVPPRPAGQRTEPEPQQGGFFPGFNLGDVGDGFQFHFGIGAFPFGIFTSINNFGQGLHVPPGQLDAQQDRFLSTIFVVMALLFLIWLILV